VTVFGWVLISIGVAVFLVAAVIAWVLAFAQVAVEDPTEDPIVQGDDQRESMETIGEFFGYMPSARWKRMPPGEDE
jgi:hypothetical protein